MYVYTEINGFEDVCVPENDSHLTDIIKYVHTQTFTKLSVQIVFLRVNQFLDLQFVGTFCF